MASSNHPSEKKMEENGVHQSSSEMDFVIDKRPFTHVKEGKAEVLFPSAHDVFYNPVQEFNRDLSVAVLRVFAAEHKERKKKKKEKAEEKLKAQQMKAKINLKEVTENGKDKENPQQEQGKEEPEQEQGKEGPQQKQGPEEPQQKQGKEGPQQELDKENPRQELGKEDPRQEQGKEEPQQKQGKETPKDTSVEADLELLPPGQKDEDGIRILEALAASGLRSIRYAREVGGVKEIVANDISKQAVECMERNITHNKVEDIVTSSLNDASLVMYQNREPSKRFDAIDLDPYGSPHAFLDGAVQSVAEGGILLVTCTDMAVLCGNSPETCYTKYGALSIKSKACHEIALRIALQSIESHANRYGRYIKPLLSMSADFYVRVVVQVFTSLLKCKESFSKVSWIYQCVGCETATLQPLGRILVNGKSVKYQLSPGPPVAGACIHCGHRHHVAGPIWSAPIHDLDFLRKLKMSLVEEDFTTFRRVFGIISMMEEELNDVPLYYVVDKLASVAGINLCKMVQLRSAILNAGFRVSMSHAAKASIKTDAPAQLIWDIVRAWEKKNPARKDKMPEDRPGRRILEKPLETEINFDLHPDGNPESRKKDLLRFQVKPEKNWGPKSRAKTSLFHLDQENKRSRNQGKKRKITSNSNVEERKHIKEDVTDAKKES